MFDVSDEELNLRILGVGDGPASFNSEMNALGIRCYQLTQSTCFQERRSRGELKRNYDTIISQVKQKPGRLRLGFLFRSSALWSLPS